ncbi:MAG: DUF1311 domain-containing protein [Clostridia bacterium]|nr:DUF1311 domain-containing protein [Clostridia bacterium]
MRKKNSGLTLIFVFIIAAMLSGCNKIDLTDVSIEKSEETTIIEEAQTTEDTDSFSFQKLKNYEFYLSSGVGAWGTQLLIHEDGTFAGIYQDAEQGESAEGYENGTIYLCEFSGAFTQPEQVNEYTYSVKIKDMQLKHSPDTEEVIDQIRYVYAEPCGLDEATDLYFYLPGAPVKELPTEFTEWIQTCAGMDETTEELPFYGLFNVSAGFGFSGYDISKTNTNEVNAADLTGTDDGIESTEDTADTSAAANPAMDEKFAAALNEVADYENHLTNDALSQQDMNEYARKIYGVWDNELNKVWKQLESQLEASQMEELRIKEREWIAYKEKEIKKAGAEFEGGSMQPCIEAMKGAEMTKARVYELAEMLK